MLKRNRPGDPDAEPGGRCRIDKFRMIPDRRALANIRLLAPVRLALTALSPSGKVCAQAASGVRLWWGRGGEDKRDAHRYLPAIFACADAPVGARRGCPGCDYVSSSGRVDGYWGHCRRRGQHDRAANNTSQLEILYEGLRVFEHNSLDL